jgi:hypothetical protein
LWRSASTSPRNFPPLYIAFVLFSTSAICFNEIETIFAVGKIEKSINKYGHEIEIYFETE